MELSHVRTRVRWAATLGLAAALALPSFPAAAQPELQTGPIASTPAACAIQLAVANPNPGEQEVPRALTMSGTALDSTATAGPGISQIQAFLGSRDQGGTLIGTAIMPGSFGGPPGAWSLTTTIPAN